MKMMFKLSFLRNIFLRIPELLRYSTGTLKSETVKKEYFLNCFLIAFSCVCAFMWAHLCHGSWARAHMWKSEDNLQESDFCFHDVDSLNQTQVTGVMAGICTR